MKNIKPVPSTQKISRRFERGFQQFLHGHIEEVFQKTPGLSCRAKVSLLNSKKLRCTPLSIRGIQHVTKDFGRQKRNKYLTKYWQAHISVNSIFRALFSFCLWWSLLYIMHRFRLQWITSYALDWTLKQSNLWEVSYGIPGPATNLTSFTDQWKEKQFTFPHLWHTWAVHSHGQVQC